MLHKLGWKCVILEKVNIQCNQQDISFDWLKNDDRHGVKQNTWQQENTFKRFFPAAGEIAFNHTKLHSTTVNFISVVFDCVYAFSGDV